VPSVVYTMALPISIRPQEGQPQHLDLPPRTISKSIADLQHGVIINTYRDYRGMLT
jgi:hypothetical protein